jgi:hypothetical protein
LCRYAEAARDMARAALTAVEELSRDSISRRVEGAFAADDTVGLEWAITLIYDGIGWCAVQILLL